EGAAPFRGQRDFIRDSLVGGQMVGKQPQTLDILTVSNPSTAFFIALQEKSVPFGSRFFLF
ncbi:hypothetical protein, partial [Streptococcus moroccensis]